jgi:RHS repeat-associated protein
MLFHKAVYVRNGFPTRRAALSLVVLLAAAIVGASQPAVATAEPACTDNWVGGEAGGWQTAANWSAGHVPSSTDVACIAAGKTAVVEGGTNHAGVVQGEGGISLNGGSLELANALEGSKLGSLSLSATLTGPATLTLTSSLTWSSGGVMAGTGSTVLGASATGSVAGCASCSRPLLTERTFVNQGTLTFSGITESLMSEGARLENSGTLKLNSEAGFAINVAEGSKTAPKILNTGTFERTEHGSVTRAVPSFENHGTVSAQSGHLDLTGGGSSNASGQWLASAGAEVIFRGGSFSLVGGKWSGPIAINGAKVTAEGVEGSAAELEVWLGESSSPGELDIASGSMTVSSLLLENSTLGGAGTLVVANALHWLSAGKMAGSGKTVLPSAAIGTAKGTSGIFSENLLLSERTLVNEGTLTLTGHTEALMSEGAKLENRGTLKVNAEDAFSINVPAESKTAPSIRNTGTFEKTELGASETRIVPSFENFGTVTATAGKLLILHPVNVEAPIQYGGPENPSTPGQPHSECGKKAVSCATGNDSDTQTDFAIGGRGVGLNLERTYNSQAGAEGTKGAFGYGWSSSFSDHLSLEPSEKRAALIQANGSRVPFSENSGVYTAPAWTQDTLSGTAEAGYTLTYPNQTKYHFAGSSGRLESVTDRNGNATTLSYGEGGRLETITDPAGRKISLTYNGEGLIESAKDPMGHVVKYAYEGGNLASVTMPGETEPSWRFKYDASHQLTEMTDGRAGKTITEYNGAHQVVSQEDPLKRKLTFEYEAFETKITNHATGAVTDERFTSNDEPYSITRSFGTASATTESLAYDAAGNVLTTTDGNNHTTKYTYDGSSNRTSMVDPEKDETKWTYNATHDVETTTTPKGETTMIKRDVHGNAEVIERPAPGAKTQLTKYGYGAHGELASVEDPLKRVWKYEYDAAGDRTAETDPEGDKRSWGYDEDSRETSTVSPRGHVAGAKEEKFKTTIERDAQGRPTLITAPLKHETKYTYDADGNLVTVTDPELNKTTYTYNADNEPTKTEAPNKSITKTEYDGAGQVASQTDGNEHTTTYMRNALEEVTEVVDPLGRKTTKEYDAAGSLTSVTDAAKRTTTYKYDAAGRLLEVSYSDGKTPTVQYEYDGDGNRIKMVDGTGTSNYVYDQLDRLTETKDGHGSITGYEYDLASEQTKVTYPNGKAVGRAYDNSGRLKSVTDWLEHTTKFGYDADSELTATTFPSGAGNEDAYAYDEADHMKEVKMSKGAEVLASLVYTRNKDGGVTKATTVGLPGEEKPAFTYDENSRVTKGAGIAYKYDAADDPTKLGTPTYTYDAAGQLEKGTGLTFTYDELGERVKTKPTSGPATTYGYDQAGSLTTVTRPHEGEVAAIEDAYLYNGNGIRASQTVSGTTAFLAWDLSQSAPVLLNDGTNSFVYGPGNLPVEQIAGESILYLHHDQQGSTRLLTGSTGTVAATTTYDAYGNKLGSTGASTTVLGYDGQYTSSDTGLIYLRARAYDPATAQFMTPDPIRAITRQPYSYAGDDAVNEGDLSGLGGCGNIWGVSDLCEGLQKSGVSDAAAQGLGVLTFGLSTQVASKVVGFNPECVDFGAGGDVGEALAFGVSFFDGEGEAELAVEGADEVATGTSAVSKARSTPGADGADSVIIKETDAAGRTVQVVHQVGDPLPGGGVVIIHQHAKFGPLPGSRLFFPDVNP